MKNKDLHATEKFKQLREELGFTQKTFAELLGIGKTTIDVERGKTKLSGYLITQLMEIFQINPAWLYGESKQKYILKKGNITPKAITIDPKKNENILMVSAKAAAGYADNICNQDFYKSLPTFGIPLPEFCNASFRCFQVEGQSMQGVFDSGDWVIARGLGSIQELHNQSFCVVVFNAGIVVKQLLKTKKPNEIILRSTNPKFEAINTTLENIHEIWEVKARLSTTVEEKTSQIHINELTEEIKDLKKAIIK